MSAIAWRDVRAKRGNEGSQSLSLVLAANRFGPNGNHMIK